MGLQRTRLDPTARPPFPGGTHYPYAHTAGHEGNASCSPHAWTRHRRERNSTTVAVGKIPWAMSEAPSNLLKFKLATRDYVSGLENFFLSFSLHVPLQNDVAEEDKSKEQTEPGQSGRGSCLAGLITSQLFSPVKACVCRRDHCNRTECRSTVRYRSSCLGPAGGTL